jgi:hypothetical protein
MNKGNNIMLYKTQKELSELKKQMYSMNWHDKIEEIDKSIESGELVIVETKARSKHIDFDTDLKNKELYVEAETLVGKIKSFNYEPTSYNKSETKSMALLSDKVARVERRVKEFTINAKSSTVYFDKDGKQLEVPKEVEA